MGMWVGSCGEGTRLGWCCGFLVWVWGLRVSVGFLFSQSFILPLFCRGVQGGPRWGELKMKQPYVIHSFIHSFVHV